MGADIGIGCMGLSDQYKQRAAECVRMAERTDNADDKALLLQMAQTWMRLAEKAEDRFDGT
jgi:putative IMPACT (imprinted ancient) family translation regulator